MIMQLQNSSEIHFIQKDISSQMEAYEVVERKGMGHPDTVCDALACKLSQAYARYTIENCDGLILHHQFDKIMLIGGKTEVTFGEIGRFIEPIRLVIAGRVSTQYRENKLPIQDLLDDTAKQYLETIFRIPNIHRDLIIEHKWTDAAGPGTIKESVGTIAEMFAPSDPSKVRGYGHHYVSNDTSYCVAFSPYTKLEQAVLRSEEKLNAKETKEELPWMGSDIKIMGVRVGEQIQITACVPQISRFVPDLLSYSKNLKIIRDILLSELSTFFNPDQIDLRINTKDDSEERNYYLTITGGSLSGDIGVTGRGNRISGLITSNRPMSMEGASGKNPRYYAGIVYNLLSKHISEQLFLRYKCSNEIIIVSQNGSPLLSPRHIIVITEREINKEAYSTIKECVSDIPKLTTMYINGEISLY